MYAKSTDLNPVKFPANFSRRKANILPYECWLSDYSQIPLPGQLKTLCERNNPSFNSESLFLEPLDFRKERLHRKREDLDKLFLLQLRAGVLILR